MLRQNAKKFIQKLLKNYLEDHQCLSVLESMDEGICWIGEGEKEILKGLKTVREFLLKEEEKLPTGLKILDFQSEVEAVNDSACVVVGTIKVENERKSEVSSVFALHISAFCVEREEKLWLKLLHTSFVTESRVTLEELRLSLERHQIIMAQTTDIIFEYDKEKKLMKISENWEKKFGYQPAREKTVAVLIHEKRIHERDVTALMDIVRKMRQNETYVENTARIRKADGTYIWCRIRVTQQMDAYGKGKRIIGVIVDIDEEMRKTQTLMNQAEKDALTGIYNKGTSEERGRQYLSELRSDEIGAMLMIDIDNFKQVNDIYGHLKGDQFLQDSARNFRNAFRKDDIVGRIGGDEFLIIMKGIPGSRIVEEKAKEVIASFLNLAKSFGYPVSCSIGIAMIPEHGKRFKELYDKADTALYEVKGSGKNSFCIYKDE